MSNVRMPGAPGGVPRGVSRRVAVDSRTRGGDDTYADTGPRFRELAALASDDPRRARLRDELVTRHVAVAKHIARKFSGRGEPTDDLEQVAMVGLIHAVDRFDPDRGIAFLSYAVPTMMGEVRRYFRDTAWAIRLPRRLSELHLTLNNAIRELSQERGRAPTTREIAKYLDISVAEVQEGLEAGQSYRAISLDDLGPDPEGSSPLSQKIGVDDPELAAVDDRATLFPILANIAERERQIVLMRFFDQMTQTQIAAQLGISQMHVSRLLSRTLEQLRSQIARADRTRSPEPTARGAGNRSGSVVLPTSGGP